LCVVDYILALAAAAESRDIGCYIDIFTEVQKRQENKNSPFQQSEEISFPNQMKPEININNSREILKWN